MQQSNPNTSLNLHVWLSGRCSFRGRLYFVFCKHRDGVPYQKALIRILSQKNFGMFRCVLANWSQAFLCLSLSVVGSSWFSHHITPFHWVGNGWYFCTLCLKVSLNLCGSWSWCFLHHSNNPPLQSSIKFSLAATSREVGYSGMGLEPIDNITYGRNKNIKVSGDWLVTLRLSMLGYNIVFDLR